MKTGFIMFAGALCVLVLWGCAPTSNSVVLPGEDGKYQVVTFGSSEKSANQEALAKATETCEQKNQSVIVVNHATQYQGGLGKGDKELLKIGGQIASMIEGQDYSLDTSSPDDYKVVMEFKCR
ncbi:MAG: hypothetical protein ACLFTF_06160 [Desulfonatronovibrio sp.]